MMHLDFLDYLQQLQLDLEIGRLAALFDNLNLFSDSKEHGKFPKTGNDVSSNLFAERSSFFRRGSK